MMMRQGQLGHQHLLTVAYIAHHLRIPFESKVMLGYDMKEEHFGILSLRVLLTMLS